MGGGLMQLVAYGAQDIYLTGNPQITFFKVVYRRHTNFAMECIQQTINGTSTLTASSTSGTVTISRNGDLVGKVYVRCDQDIVEGISGDSLISEVELEIGGQKIDKHYKEWNQLWAELTTSDAKAAGYKYMTGGFNNTLASAATGQTAAGASSSTGQQSIMVPLNFWFCRNPGLALPLIALQYHEVKLKFTWGLTTTVARDDGTITTAPACEVWCDYIYLDTDERRRFAQVSHEYLIEQLQKQETAAAATSSIKLNFNHPVKELIWTNTSADITTQKTKLVLNGHDRFTQQDREYFQLRQPLDHHTAVPGFNIKEVDTPVMINPIHTGVLLQHASAQASLTDATLVAASLTVSDQLQAATPIRVGDVLSIAVGGHDADDMAKDAVDSHIVQVASVSTAAHPVCVFVTAIPAGAIHSAFTTADGLQVDIIARSQDPRSRCSQLSSDINVYSFALKPEEHQPSGTCNFSRIDNAKLNFSAASGSNGAITVYAVNYNVLRIMSGMGGLAYSN
jgi:hypothetical protein